jgi:hypothetical protein
MHKPNDENLIRDVRFWLALAVIVALLSFVVLSYPG